MAQARKVGVMRRLERVAGRGWACLACWVWLGQEVEAVVLLVEEGEAGSCYKEGLCANHAEVLDITVVGQVQKQDDAEVEREV